MLIFRILGGLLVPKYRGSHTEHREVHGHEHKGDDDADEDNHHRFEPCLELLETLFEPCGADVRRLAEHVGEPVALFSDPDHRQQPLLEQRGVFGHGTCQSASVAY